MNQVIVNNLSRNQIKVNPGSKTFPKWSFMVLCDIGVLNNYIEAFYWLEFNGDMVRNYSILPKLDIVRAIYNYSSSLYVCLGR